LYDTGFDPHQMAVFFAKLAEEGGARGPQFLSDHPDPGNRSQKVSAEVATLPKKNSYRGNSAEFLQVKQRVAGMKPLTAQQIAGQPAATNAPGGVSPAAAMRDFNHSEYRISYPENWQVFGDSNSSVTIAPQNGVSQNAVSYGAIINDFQPENSTDSLDEATHDLVASLRQSNSDLRQIGHDETIRVNRIAGKSVDLIGSSPLKDQNGRTIQERDWLVTFQQKDGSLLYLVFISPDKDFGTMRPTYEQMLKTLRLR
jgi:hypothetical protein